MMLTVQQCKVIRAMRAGAELHRYYDQHLPVYELVYYGKRQRAHRKTVKALQQHGLLDYGFLGLELTDLGKTVELPR